MGPGLSSMGEKVNERPGAPVASSRYPRPWPGDVRLLLGKLCPNRATTYFRKPSFSTIPLYRSESLFFR